MARRKWKKIEDMTQQEFNEYLVAKRIKGLLAAALGVARRNKIANKGKEMDNGIR